MKKIVKILSLLLLILLLTIFISNRAASRQVKYLYNSNGFKITMNVYTDDSCWQDCNYEKQIVITNLTNEKHKFHLSNARYIDTEVIIGKNSMGEKIIGVKNKNESDYGKEYLVNLNSLSEYKGSYEKISSFDLDKDGIKKEISTFITIINSHSIFE